MPLACWCYYCVTMFGVNLSIKLPVLACMAYFMRSGCSYFFPPQFHFEIPDFSGSGEISSAPSVG